MIDWKEAAISVLQEHYEYALGLVILLGLLIVIGGKGKVRSKISGSFKAIPYLNTKAEQNFFMQLERKLPDHLYIACKVRLADLCKPDNHKNITAFNKISKKHVDFVLVSKGTSKVVCAIELDDKSHQSKSAVKRDNEKSYALQSAGISLHRVKAGRGYSKSIDAILLNLQAGQEKTISAKEVSKECPRCSGDMELIKMKLLNRGKGYYLCENCGYNTEPKKLNL